MKKKDLTYRQAAARLKKMANGRMCSTSKSDYFHVDGVVNTDFSVYIEGPAWVTGGNSWRDALEKMQELINKGND